MNRKLAYVKQPGKRELDAEKVESKSALQSKNVSMPSVSDQIPSAYRKDDGVLSYSLICVISGGTRRERVFLNELDRKHTFRTVSVIFLSSKKSEGGLTPKMMKSLYESICKDGSISMPNRNVKLDAVDKVYMFTDVDHYEDELQEIVQEFQEESPVWIISNPDFEIWLYYCYRNDPYVDLREVLNEIPSQRSSRLKTVNGTFNNHGGLDTRKAFEHIEEGILHSKEHYQEKNGVPGVLSTQMHVFAEDVLLRLGSEYSEFLQMKQNLSRLRGKNEKDA